MKKETKVEVVKAKAKELTIEEEVALVAKQGVPGKILTAEQYAVIAHRLIAVNGMIKKVDAKFKPNYEKAKLAKESAKQLWNDFRDPLVEIKDASKREMLDYDTRARLVEQAELDRKRRELEEKVRASAEEEKALRAAEALEAGDLEGVDEILGADVVVDVSNVPIKVESRVPVIEGISSRKTYKAEVEFLFTLIRAVANREVPMDVLLPNMPRLNDMARDIKKAGPLCPGVVVVEVSGMNSGS